MKKIFSILLLIIAFVTAMCIPVYATGSDVITADSGESITSVTGNYEPGVVGDTVIHVEIQWNNLSFTYHGAREAVWDPQTCTYSQPEDEGWNASNASISVINRSNTGISVIPVYEAAEGYSSADMNFSTNDLHVISADTGAGGPQSGTITVTPTGSLPEGTSNQIIGHITVTISETE